MKNYRNRILDEVLAFRLEAAGAVLIEGSKWCGKTTTAERHAKSILSFADPDSLENNLSLVDVDSAALLKGDTPRLIDEWQIAPKLWDAVRFQVDHRDGVGHFILTGSSVPVEPEEKRKIRHTGTGRISRLTMRPMSLFESGESTGAVSLGELFTSGTVQTSPNSLKLEDIAFAVCRGGWPQTLDLKPAAALTRANDYVDAVVNSDISRSDGVARSPERALRLLRSYARLQGFQANYETIRKDMAANDSDTLIDDTVASYVSALKRVFVVEDMPAWEPHLRSKTVLRTTDTRYFVDPSIAAAAMGFGPNDLLRDIRGFGLYFEGLAVRDLRVYADALDGKVSHYRDKTGLECDAIVHLRNGSYGLVEIKLGGERLIESAVETLNALAGKIDTDRMPSPAFKMVLTAVGSYAYRRSDGIVICPIGCLGHHGV